MKKIKINIKQISSKNSIQNITFNKSGIELGTLKEIKNFQNINLNDIIGHLNVDDKVVIRITNKEQKNNKGENNEW